MNGLLAIHWKRMTRNNKKFNNTFKILCLVIFIIICLCIISKYNAQTPTKNIIEPHRHTNILIKNNNPQNVYNALNYGLSSLNTGEENSLSLQSLINSIPSGNTIYIPKGEYIFAAIGNQSIGSHCIKMRSNINIIGDGSSTVLKPIGNSEYGIDMFYFNELLDSNTPTYLENCTFKNFVIDAIGTSTKTYTSAGKGFMFNLCKNCHWEDVTVKNTDGTGFGMDCPIDCSIINCIAISCGKSATVYDTGASGFGIGIGFSNNEGIVIRDCLSVENKKFGFFFEHQGIFNPVYQATESNGFYVEKCEAYNNYYNFGGIKVYNVTYCSCISGSYIADDFYFKDSSNYRITNCF